MNIVITGCGRGIGAELAGLFTSNENNTVFLISKSEERLDKLISKLKQKPKSARIIKIACDLTEFDSANLVGKISEHAGNIDILINNAGYLEKNNFEDFSTSSAESIFKVNFFAPAKLIQSLLPMLKKSERAHVVNIGSIGGFQGSVKFPGLSYYSSSKAAIASLTECLAEEFKKTNIRFNCLALGAVQTEMLNEAFPGYKAPVDATEMAEFIYDFALNSANLINGKVIPVSLSTP